MVSSRPGTNRSTMTSSSNLNASVTAAASSPGSRTIDSPTVLPCFDGFTTTGQSRRRPTSFGSIVPCAGAISQSAVATPAARSTTFDKCLSMASALAKWPLPVYGTPTRSRSACTVPSSPWPPCSARNTHSASVISVIVPRAGERLCEERPASASSDGGALPTPAASKVRSVSRVSTPSAGSRQITSWPFSRRAMAIRSPDDNDT